MTQTPIPNCRVDGDIYCTNGGEGKGLGTQRSAEWKQDSSTACLCVEGTEGDPLTAFLRHEGGDRTGMSLTHNLLTVWREWDGTHPLLAHHMEETILVCLRHRLSMSRKGWYGTHPLLACVVPPLEVQDQLLPHRLVSGGHRQGCWRWPALSRSSG